MQSYLTDHDMDELFPDHSKEEQEHIRKVVTVFRELLYDIHKVRHDNDISNNHSESL